MLRPIKSIYYSSRFLSSLKKLPVNLAKEAQKRELIFRADCFDPKLRTHKLKGKLQAHWSFSITQKYRILFRFITNNAVLFIDVGDHTIYD